jgi:hypothetical protein
VLTNGRGRVQIFAMELQTSRCYRGYALEFGRNGFQRGTVPWNWEQLRLGDRTESAMRGGLPLERTARYLERTAPCFDREVR